MDDIDMLLPGLLGPLFAMAVLFVIGGPCEYRGGGKWC